MDPLLSFPDLERITVCSLLAACFHWPCVSSGSYAQRAAHVHRFLGNRLVQSVCGEVSKSWDLRAARGPAQLWMCPAQRTYPDPFRGGDVLCGNGCSLKFK